ncbi:outer membrane beta-barrel protein [uncultured Campylobacter sp.]|uniref:outer membrane beta-barrel protein n=1 Tax=uncultured Campylobacter sp. TaxID=218934 RepID=UPI002617C6DE|nr:outer membrane beta-barrel protein [uncultured Campylobacter sp.]
MKKIFIAFLLYFSLFSFAKAEVDGFYFGGGLGYASVNIKPQDANGDNLNLHFILGHKLFFNENMGIRVYGNFLYDWMNGLPSHAGNVGSYYHLGANVDFLYNFINRGYTSYGAFVGLNLGFTFWNTTSLDTYLNFGLRAAFNDAHSLELAFRVPFEYHTLNSSTGKEGKQVFNPMLRYVYTFSDYY